ncbi:Uncharacterised protein [Serratia entomophila]|uniref:hypothetical protein n=1 Tax=Serratia entomophila TaxID=42906 RepID=UPI0021779FF0|nr:hypothetical protein [Serratia entomophila]CAI1926415.1 Uncharacterised protein [Serratia entomophila]
MSDSNPVYDEACRQVGICCFMLAQNGEEISRRQVVFQLERLLVQYEQITGETNLAMELAIEQLIG